MSRRRAITLIVILSLILSGILFINYNMRESTKSIDEILSSKYKAPANKAFDDSNFYKCVIDDYNDTKGGEPVLYTTNLSDAQLKTIKILSCESKKVTSLKGIEKLSNLETALLSGNSLGNIDLSNSNSKLKDFEVSESKVESIALGSKPNLTTLKLSENNLKKIEIGSIPKLDYLDVSNNQLNQNGIDLGSNTKLTYLNVSNCGLNTLTVSNNTNLVDLYAGKNNLSSLNLNNNNKLINLGIENNNINDIDELALGTKENLAYLNIENNEFTSINLENNTNLTWLVVTGNKLDELNVSFLKDLNILAIGGNNLKEINVTNNTKLTNFFMENDGSTDDITDIDLSNNDQIEELHINNSKLETLNLKNISKLSQTMLNEILNKNENLKKLTLGNNNTSINISNNQNIQELVIEEDPNKASKINSLTLKNTNLTNVTLTKLSALSKIDMSGNNKLTDLSLRVGKLNQTMLDDILKNNTNLINLTISNNQFESIKINSTSLQKLIIKNMPNMATLGGNIPNLTDLTLNNVHKLNSLNMDLNKLKVMSVDDLNVLDSFKSSTLEELTLADINMKSFELSSVNKNNFPKLKTISFDNEEIDEITIDKSFDFENIKINISAQQLTVNRDSTLKELNLSESSFSKIDIRGKNLENLTLPTDISDLVNILVNISVEYTKLTQLDLSNTTNLQKLVVCENELLKSIILPTTEDHNLTYIDIHSNNFTDKKLDLSNYYGLNYVDASDNKLENLELQESLPNLTEINVNSNNLKNLNLNSATKLQKIDAHDNELESLELPTSLPNLTEIYVNTNKLKKLDLNNSTKLQKLYANGSNTYTLESIVLPASLPDLIELDLSFNKLKEQLNLNSAINLQKINVSYNKLKGLILPSVAKDLNEMKISNNELESLELSTEIPKLTTIDVHNNKLQQLDLSNYNNITSVNVSYNELYSLILPNSIREVVANHNYLTELDLSKCSNLTKIYVNSNKLKNLNLSNSSQLQEIDASDNELESLELPTEISGLTTINVGSNKLKQLNLSAASKLEEIDVHQNKLKGLILPLVAENLVRMKISNNELESLELPTEIPQLTIIYVDNNKLKQLDLSTASKLQYISASDNELENLKLPTNASNLQHILVHNNKLKQLDLSTVSNLQYISASDNELESLELPTNASNLQYIVVHNNKLKQLDLSTVSNLQYISASDNELKSLELPASLPNLTEIYVDSNKLKQLDLSTAPNLEEIYASDNELESLILPKSVKYVKAINNKLQELDVSGCQALKYLTVYNNKLINIYFGTTTLENLYKIDASFNLLKTIDISNLPNLEYLYLNSNLMSSVDTSNNPKLSPYTLVVESIPLNPNFDDGSLYKCVVNSYNSINNTKYTTQDILNNEQLKEITKLDCSNRHIFSTKGIELMPNLQKLLISDNYVSKIDVRNNLNLTNLDVHFNNLTGIDVRNNLNLTNLDVHYNNLTEIDVSNNTDLTELAVSYNKLTEIDVSNNTKLTNLKVSSNKLTGIDVSNNTDLTELAVSYNKLTEIDVSNNTDLQRLDVSHNNLTEIDVRNNKKIANIDSDKNPFNLGEITIYKNNFDLNYALGNGNYKTSDNITKTFISANETITDSKVTFNKSGVYKYEIKFDVLPWWNKISKCNSGYYTINVKLVNLSSTKYKVNNDKNYIYTGLDTDNNTILSNLKVEGGDGTLEIKDNKVLIKNNNEILREYTLINILKQTDYDLSKDYIYTKISDFNKDNVKINIDNQKGLEKEVINTNNIHQFNIKYDDDILATYNLVSIKSNSYKIYNKWIYITGNFDINKITTTNATLTENNGVLEVKYNNQIIDSLKELKIDFGELRVIENNIVLKEEITYDDFMKNINSSTLTSELYKGNTLVTSGNIEKGMTLKVKSSTYGEIMTYTITNEYVDVSKLGIDENGYVSKYELGTTYQDIQNDIMTSGSVKFIDDSGNKLSLSDIIRTGSKIIINTGTEEKEYTLVVYGDVNGDGEISIFDINEAIKYKDPNKKNDCYKEAADVVKDGKIDIFDYNEIIKLKRKEQ